MPDEDSFYHSSHFLALQLATQPSEFSEKFLITDILFLVIFMLFQTIFYLLFSLTLIWRYFTNIQTENLAAFLMSAIAEDQNVPPAGRRGTHVLEWIRSRTPERR